MRGILILLIRDLRRIRKILSLDQLVAREYHNY